MAVSWPCGQLTEPALCLPASASSMLAHYVRCDSVQPRLCFAYRDNMHYVIGDKKRER